MASLGLDIGYRSIKAVVLAGDGTILKAVKVEFSETSENGDPKACIQAIKKLIKDHNLPVDNIIINLHGSYILTRTYLLPSGNANGFEKWFVENIESLIPGVPFSDVIYDHQFLPSGRVLISFARLGVVEDRISILKECGLLPRAIDAACLALLYVYENHPWVKNKKTIAILDASKDGTDLLIIKEGEPFISSEIPASIAGEKAKQSFCEQLAARLSQVFEYYREKEKVNTDRMILVGDYPHLNQIKRELAVLLNIKVELGRPFAMVKTAMPAGFKPRNSGQFAQAYGLAIKGLNSRKDINLMPPEKRELHRQWQFDRRSRQFFSRHIAFAGIALLIILLAYGVVARNNNKMRTRITELEAQKQALLAVNTEENEYRQKIAMLQELRRDRVSWTKTLNSLGTAVPVGICLTGIKTESRLVTDQSGAVKTIRIIIQGDAANKNAIVSFVKNLEPHFSKIAVDKISEDEKCEFKISLAL